MKIPKLKRRSRKWMAKRLHQSWNMIQLRIHLFMMTWTIYLVSAIPWDGLASFLPRTVETLLEPFLRIQARESANKRQAWWAFIQCTSYNPKNASSPFLSLELLHLKYISQNYLSCSTRIHFAVEGICEWQTCCRRFKPLQLFSKKY